MAVSSTCNLCGKRTQSGSIAGWVFQDSFCQCSNVTLQATDEDVECNIRENQFSSFEFTKVDTGRVWHTSIFILGAVLGFGLLLYLTR